MDGRLGAFQLGAVQLGGASTAPSAIGPGTCAITSGASGSMSGTGALTGECAVATTATGHLAGIAGLTASTSITVGATAALAGTGALTGTAVVPAGLVNGLAYGRFGHYGVVSVAGRVKSMTRRGRGVHVDASVRSTAKAEAPLPTQHPNRVRRLQRVETVVHGNDETISPRPPRLVRTPWG